MRLKTGLVIIIMLLSTISLFSNGHAIQESSMLYVGGSGNGNYSTITSALTDAANKDIVTVFGGIYEENIIINKKITLESADNNPVIIKGDGLSNVITIASEDVSINNITIMNSGKQIISEDGFKENKSVNDTNNENTSLNPVMDQFDIGTSFINYSGIFSDYGFTKIKNCSFLNCDSALFLRNLTNGFIQTNQIYNNSNAIYIVNAVDITITDCMIHNNFKGIIFDDVNNAIVHGNTIYSHDDIGANLQQTIYSTFHHNQFENNSIGIVLNNQCEDNVFYQNNFINNRGQHVIDNCNNSWDNGIIGNYWDTYDGNDVDNDGIGDDTHYIPAVSIDHFPLMQSIDLESKTIQIIIEKPSLNEAISGDYLLQGSIQSEDEISQVKVSINAENWMLAEGTEDWQKSINTSQYQDGDYTLMVSVLTINGQSYFKQHQISIDNTKDEITNNIDESPGFYFSMILLAFICILLLYRKR